MSDLISRQAAIDALKVAYWDKDIQSAKDDPCIVDAMTDWAIRQVKNLPSETHEIRTETHGVCSYDLISRNAALALVVKAIHGTDNKDIKDYLFGGLRKQLWALPSAEPKTGGQHDRFNQQTGGD